jgi:hypothetical protein
VKAHSDRALFWTVVAAVVEGVIVIGLVLVILALTGQLGGAR